jgi:tRNA uridine 5-carbamoylmethylation protein Kti12
MLAIVTVGLPARGKTYLAQKLCRYLRWLGINASIFSIGDYRRKLIGTNVSHDFFNAETTKAQRMEVANKALDDLIGFLNQQGGQVGIYDGSNTEQDRRDYINQKLCQNNIQVNSFGRLMLLGHVY